jgi:hypothetical protein
MASRQEKRAWRKECKTQGERWVRGQQEASIGSGEKLQYQRRWLKRQELKPYFIGAVASFLGAALGASATLGAAFIRGCFF